MNGKKWIVFGLMFLLISCATITVNVYFPDKDVEAAYESIESGLDFDVIQSKKDTSTVKPKSRSEAFFGASAAWAESKVNINAELKKMENVQESLERRRERIEILGRLFDAKLVGLAKTGLVVRLPESAVEGGPSETPESIFGEEKADKALSKFMEDENRDRQILVKGMAVATLRATEQDEKDEDTLNNAVEKSRGLFAKSQQGKLKEGWFYQDDKGKWLKVAPPEVEEESKPSKESKER